MNIFTYGSLMYPQVWREVVRGDYQHSAAVIQGYWRVAVRNESYPMLVPGGADAAVSGVLYRDVTAGDLARLDDFEGLEYDRVTRTVSDSEKKPVSCNVYVANALGIKRALNKPWDQVLFEKKGLQEFCNDYVGYTRVTER